MSAVTDETYIQIFSRFLEGGSGTDDMFTDYWKAYGEETRVGDVALFGILQDVFYVMEEYDSDPELRSDDSPTDADVRAAIIRAQAALEDRRA